MTFKYENSYGGVGNNLELVGFFYADCVGDLEFRKSTSRYLWWS